MAENAIVYAARWYFNALDIRSLALFNNTNLYTVYLEHFKEQRKLKPSSFKPYNCCCLPNLRMPLFQDLPCINVNARIKHCGDANFHIGIRTQVINLLTNIFITI